MPTKAKAKAQPATKAPVAAKPATPRESALAAHAQAGFTGNVYTGLSKTRNAAVAHVIDTTTSKATARTYAALTPRMHATLSELAKAYGTKAFLARGIDRGQAAIFIASGFCTAVAGTGHHANGVYSDVAAQPLRLTLSAECVKRYA